MKLSITALALGQAVRAAPSEPSLPIRLETRAFLNTHLANVHLMFDEPVDDLIKYTYGSCSSIGERDVHHAVGQGYSSHDRLVWVMPEDVTSGGCISAWSSSGALLGRSEKQQLDIRSKRGVLKRGFDSIGMTSENGIDPWGAWFDGVELLKGKHLSAVNVAKAKRKDVAVVGAGMSGLMTYLCLTQAGLTNVTIIEAGERLGGRVHTEYLSGGPFDYSYQEMGPMRFPFTYTVGNETYPIKDHQLVFQLAEEMNKINRHDKNLSVDFIPWYQSNSNGLQYYNGIRLPNGMPPTLAQVAANASLSIPSILDKSTQDLETAVNNALPGPEFMAKLATNMFKAHREFLDGGLGGLPGDQWSEYGFMVNYLKANLNDTDIVASSATATFWDELYDGVYFGADTWQTIDGGLNRLPLSFHPLVDKVTTMNRSVERIKYSSSPCGKKVTLQSRSSYSDTLQNSTHDYVVLAVPFSVMKNWRIDGLPITIRNAISNLPYTAACKVALEFNTRFWEHYKNPIYGSCSTNSDIPGIGSICYPSYNINGTGPATILGSYISGSQWGARWASAPEAEHVQYVLNAMIEIHGDVAREQYSGNYNRRCWMLDPLESASWASPRAGQHQLYLPEYFKTHNNMIFVGEHTSYTHAWIASALESGVRGSVQLLLELGLVDEAKATAEKWMARWMEV